MSVPVFKPSLGAGLKVDCDATLRDKLLEAKILLRDDWVLLLLLLFVLGIFFRGRIF